MRMIVGNLSPEVSRNDLAELFSKYGKVSSVDIRSNSSSEAMEGQVEMENGGNIAITNLNGFSLKGRRITIADADSDNTYKSESQRG